MGLRSLLRRSPAYGPYTALKYRRRSDAREALFTGFYRDNIWGDPESASGSGSNLTETAQLRADLPVLLRDIDARSLLDVPCGDFAWMQHVDLGDVTYIGGDIVSEMIDALQARYGRPGRSFQRLDLVSDALPRADVVMVRDLFLHLPLALITQAAANVKRSGATWLLASNYTEATSNPEIPLGQHRFPNLQIAPFRWPAPQRVIQETATDGRSDKQLGLWRVADLPV